jgi:4-amino-4-deoxy-L-arabinose transferase-like glycosyltransferase
MMGRTQKIFYEIYQKSLRLPAFLVIILLWAVLFVPNTGLRALYDEEGRRAFLAMDVLDNGNWLQPDVLGKTYINKPPLQPWMTAVTARATGKLDEWSVRLPALLMTLSGALLVYGFTRMHGSKAGALWAAAAFMLSPLVMEKARLGETDTTVTVMVLAAFYIWWRGVFENRLHLGTWVLCGLCLSAVSMAKGPVPIAFFALAVFMFTVVRKRFKEIAGLGLAVMMSLLAVGAWGLAVYEPGNTQMWVKQMRMAPESGALFDYVFAQARSTGAWIAALLPWLLIGLPALVPGWARRIGIDKDFSLLLLLYTAGFAILLVFWPGIKPRYVMPVAPALAIAAGMAWEGLRQHRKFRRVFILMMILPAAFQLTFNYIVLPVQKDKFTIRKQAGQNIGRILENVSEPIYVVNLSHNMLFYTGLNMEEVEKKDAASLTGPAWVIVSESNFKDFSRSWDGRCQVHAEVTGKKKKRYYIVRLL